MMGGTHIPYDWLALRLAYTMSRHEPLRIYLGDFRWSIYDLDRTFQWANDLAARKLRP